MTEMAAGGATVEELESLYRADLPRFVRAATAIVGDEGAGRDAVQEAFVQAVRKRTGYTTAHFADDVAALAATDYRTVMLAKCEGTADLVHLEDFEVLALCETALGVLAAPEVAALANVSALMWGAEDLVASLGGSSSRHADGRYRDVATHARSQVLLAAGAHGVAAIDTVHLEIADAAGLRAEAEDAAAVGFAATACIHPSQVPIVREAYRPDAARLEWARAVLAAATTEPGVFAFRGEMVDAPVLRQAEALVRRAGRG